MAKKAYIGVNGFARNIKKGYVGVGNTARRIKKAYVGVGGVARPCWPGGLEYYGTITPLSTARYYMGAATVGNYALFGGGYTRSYSNVVDAYDASLTRSTPTPLSTARYQIAAATVGNYALFGGGDGVGVDGSTVYCDVVDAYTV